MNVGLLAAAGGVARLPMNIPRCVAMEMLLTAQPISGERALTLGLVNYCVPTDQVLPTALALAKAITKNSPIAVRSTRNAVKLGAGRPEQDGLMLEAIFGEKVMASADAIEGPKAFVEKRPPVWAKL
jgi:enoyl-CoA hydratase